MTAALVISLLLVGWTFAGYPALVIALAAGRRSRGERRHFSAAVTLLICARNEAGQIGGRIANLLEQACPAGQLEVLVVDDGSEDDTAGVVARMDDPRVRLIRMERPAGKAAALNCGMAQITTALTIFADARQRFEPQAIRHLVAAFGDPEVGLAAGRLELGEGERISLYWRVETALRRAEARIGWAHAATGAIYAIRTRLFQPLPAGLVLDDLWTPLQVARAGHRLVFVDEAVAIEPAAMTAGAEFRRKLRTLSGNWQLIAHAPWLLVPWRNELFFAWFSHKFLRLLAPWALALALVVSLLAVVAGASAWLQLAFWLQLAAWLVAVLALMMPAIARRVPLATAAGSFLLLNAAALISLPAWLGRRRADRLWRG